MTALTSLPLFDWRPPASVIPFPLHKRRSLIERTANSVAHRGRALGSRDPAATGEKLLQAAIRAQRDIMCRRGIDQEAIERELQQFETAVRVLAARLTKQDGAA